MPKQIVRLHDVDVPDDFEPTGEFRTPKAGEWFIDTDGEVRHAAEDCRAYVHVILHRIEPTAVRLARLVKQPNVDRKQAHRLADLVIADFERESK
jgi:hypothetical protein